MNYPNRMKVNQNEIIEEKPIQFANRGMDFEKAVNSSNLFYDEQKRAIITKRPTLWKDKAVVDLVSLHSKSIYFPL